MLVIFFGNIQEIQIGFYFSGKIFQTKQISSQLIALIQSVVKIVYAYMAGFNAISIAILMAMYQTPLETNKFC
jgi:hypothetical protein